VLALNERRNLLTALGRGKPRDEPESSKTLSRAIESYLAQVCTRRSEKSAKRTGQLMDLLPSSARIITLTRSPTKRCSCSWPTLPMGILMTWCAEGDQVLCGVIALPAPPLNVMDLKIFHSPAPLTTPSISLQNFTAELAIRFRVKPQAWSFCKYPLQKVTCTSSRSCFLCGFGRPTTSRVRQGNRASRLPASKLTPARKSAQIISKQ
jgi:hypothetical protein